MDPKSQRLRFHTQTCGSTLTAQEPENNIVRVSLQALSAILGGTQSLHTNSFDEALNLPSEKSVKIALRTQQILAFETEIPDIIDPFGGSYCMEKLTDSMEAETESLLKSIKEKGGAIECIKNGFSRNLIEESAYLYQTEIEKNQRKIVGLNFPKQEKIESPIRPFSRALGDERRNYLESFRNARNNEKAQESLDKLQKMPKGAKNLMPGFIDAVKNSCTLGEITNVLAKEFGTYD